jgi:hypothetical protein
MNLSLLLLPVPKPSGLSFPLSQSDVSQAFSDQIPKEIDKVVAIKLNTNTTINTIKSQIINMHLISPGTFQTKTININSTSDVQSLGTTNLKNVSTIPQYPPPPSKLQKETPKPRTKLNTNTINTIKSQITNTRLNTSVITPGKTFPPTVIKKTITEASNLISIDADSDISCIKAYEHGNVVDHLGAVKLII